MAPHRDPTLHLWPLPALLLCALAACAEEALHTITSPSAESPNDVNLFSTAQRDQIQRVLQRVGGNKAAAAKLLGMSRRSLYRWLERLDLPQ